MRENKFWGRVWRDHKKKKGRILWSHSSEVPKYTERQWVLRRVKGNKELRSQLKPPVLILFILFTKLFKLWNKLDKPDFITIQLMILIIIISYACLFLLSLLRLELIKQKIPTRHFYKIFLHVKRLRKLESTFK